MGDLQSSCFPGRHEKHIRLCITWPGCGDVLFPWKPQTLVWDDGLKAKILNMFPGSWILSDLGFLSAERKANISEVVFVFADGVLCVLGPFGINRSRFWTAAFSCSQVFESVVVGCIITLFTVSGDQCFHFWCSVTVWFNNQALLRFASYKRVWKTFETADNGSVVYISVRIVSLQMSIVR